MVVALGESRWPTAALVAALPTLACSTGGDEDRLQVIEVERTDDGRIILTFSEPVEDPGAVDPDDFRLSQAKARRAPPDAYHPYLYTAYFDLGYVVDGSDLDRVVSIEVGASPDQLVLTTEQPLPFDDLCAQINDYFDYWDMYYSRSSGARLDLGLFVHYAAGDVPIEGESGKTLADIAGDWVHVDSYYTFRDSYGIASSLRIPC